jgi:hypothetical protein
VMSWSVAAIGKSSAVRAAIANQFANGSKCAEPEETIRQAAAAVIDKALEAQAEATAVKVSASGSQSSSGGIVTNNSLSIMVDPMWGFVE